MAGGSGLTDEQIRSLFEAIEAQDGASDEFDRELFKEALRDALDPALHSREAERRAIKAYFEAKKDRSAAAVILDTWIHRLVGEGEATRAADLTALAMCLSPDRSEELIGNLVRGAEDAPAVFSFNAISCIAQGFRGASMQHDKKMIASALLDNMDEEEPMPTAQLCGAAMVFDLGKRGQNRLLRRYERLKEDGTEDETLRECLVKAICTHHSIEAVPVLLENPDLMKLEWERDMREVLEKHPDHPGVKEAMTQRLGREDGQSKHVEMAILAQSKDASVPKNICDNLENAMRQTLVRIKRMVRHEGRGKGPNPVHDWMVEGLQLSKALTEAVDAICIGFPEEREAQVRALELLMIFATKKERALRGAALEAIGTYERNGPCMQVSSRLMELADTEKDQIVRTQIALGLIRTARPEAVAEGVRIIEEVLKRGHPGREYPVSLRNHISDALRICLLNSMPLGEWEQAATLLPAHQEISMEFLAITRDIISKGENPEPVFKGFRSALMGLARAISGREDMDEGKKERAMAHITELFKLNGIMQSARKGNILDHEGPSPCARKGRTDRGAYRKMGKLRGC